MVLRELDWMIGGCRLGSGVSGFRVGEGAGFWGFRDGVKEPFVLLVVDAVPWDFGVYGSVKTRQS